MPGPAHFRKYKLPSAVMEPTESLHGAAVSLTESDDATLFQYLGLIGAAVTRASASETIVIGTGKYESKHEGMHESKHEGKHERG